jgi:hypothetical protein
MRLAYVRGSARRNQATAQKTRDCQQSADWLLTTDIWPIAPLSSSLVLYPWPLGIETTGSAQLWTLKLGWSLPRGER